MKKAGGRIHTNLMSNEHEFIRQGMATQIIDGDEVRSNDSFIDYLDEEILGGDVTPMNQIKSQASVKLKRR